MIAKFRPVFLYVASISFGLGMALPLMRFEKFWIFSETPSLLAIIAGLWQEEETVLAIIVTTFSLIFPAIKLLTAYLAVFSNQRTVGWAASLAKWSMLDVLLVAIVIFAAKTSGLASAVSQPGLWFFTLSAVTVAIATVRV